MTYGSLFTGIGGLDLGLDRAGFECKWQVEIDPYALKVLQKHWPNVTRYGDITKLSGDELEPVDLMCGGFPCQDLSQAGKQAGIEGTRSGLWFEYARLIRKLRPKYVLIENVPGLLIHDAMRRVIGELARLGYVGIWRSLRASEFGASHLRKRVFIIAYLENSARHVQPGREREDRRMRGRGIRVPGESLAHGSGVGRSIGGAAHHRNGHHASGYDVNGCDQDVAYGALRGLGIMREPSGSNGLVNGSHEELAWFCEHYSVCHNPNQCEGSDCWLRRAGRDYPAGFESGPDYEDYAEHLADSLRTGLEVRDGKRELQIRGDTTTLAPSLPAFAPGPSDGRWPYILGERPDLAPALPQIRGVANGTPDWMDRAMKDRTKRLGRLGNAVVPQISEWIGNRIMEFEKVYA